MIDHDEPSLRYVDALECVVAGAPTVIALQAAGQVVELDVMPLPLAAGHVRGIGIHAGQVIVSVGPGDAASAPRRRTTAVLLALPAAQRMALEVTSVVGFVRIRLERGAAGDVAGAITSDGRRLRWLDVRTFEAAP